MTAIPVTSKFLGILFSCRLFLLPIHFDTVNLYGGETKLVFLYKNYPNKPDDSVDEQAIREELYSRISHLLIEYGSTLDNKDHGKT